MIYLVGDYSMNGFGEVDAYKVQCREQNILTTKKEHKVSDPKEQVFGQGRELFKQGDKGGELYFIKEGKVELLVRNADTGEEAVVATVGDRNVLGAMSFLEGDPRSATAKCLTEVKAIVINQTQRERMLGQVPAWMQILLKDLSGNIRRLNSEYTRLTAENEKLTKRVETQKQRIKKFEQDIEDSKNA